MRIIYYNKRLFKVTQFTSVCSFHGKFVQRKSIHGCMALPKHHQLLLIQTLTPFPPLTSHPVLPQVSTSNLCLLNIFNTPTCRLTRQSSQRRTQTLLTAYSSGVTFRTSNTTASKLFFSSEEPFSLRESELLLFWRRANKTHIMRLSRLTYGIRKTCVCVVSY